MPLIRSFIFLSAALAGVLAGAQASPSSSSSDCWTSIHNDTIACFNSGPITFSFDYSTALECQNWCGKVRNCEAWVYVDHSGQCDLHRTVPVTVSNSTGFTFGGCEPVAHVVDIVPQLKAGTR